MAPLKFLSGGALLAYLLPLVVAEVPLWGQCGGKAYVGETTCPEGAFCSYLHEWYSQCIPIPDPTATTGPAPTPTALPIDPKANFWFSFGDSYTQTGFNPSLTPPNTDNPLGNPTFPGWTSTGGGPNWVGFVTTTYNNSLLYTYNYAYGGATIDATLVEPYDPSVLSLTDQVTQFVNSSVGQTGGDGSGLEDGSGKWTSENSLFSIWIGINDLGGSWWKEGDRNEFADVLLDAEFALVEKLYAAGARNFMFVNVPPIERSPLLMASGDWAVETSRGVINGFNAKVAERTAALEATHEGVKTWLYDTHAQFNELLDNPTEYGFTDATTYGEEPGLFWINDFHPTGPVHKYLAEEVGRNVLGETVW